MVLLRFTRSFGTLISNRGLEMWESAYTLQQKVLGLFKYPLTFLIGNRESWYFNYWFLYDSVQILYLLIAVFKVIDFYFFFFLILRLRSKCNYLVKICHLLCLNSLTHESHVSNIALTSGVLFSPRQLPEFLFFSFILNIWKYLWHWRTWESGTIHFCCSKTTAL